MLRQRAIGWMLVLPAVLLICTLFVYPLVVVLSKSFTDPMLGFENYIALWDSKGFRNILGNTFEIAFWTTAISLVVAYPFAYKLASLPPRRARVLLTLSLVPFFTSILARLYAWTLILGRRGILNDFLARIGVIHDPLNLLYTRYSVIIGTVHVMLPYMILILYAVMSGIDRSLLDASRALGAGGLSTFRRVYLPLSMPGVFAGSILVFILSLGFFITPAVLGGGGDITIATYVQQQVAILQWGVATAMSALLLVVTVVLFIVFNRIFGAERLLTGGVRR